METERSLPKTAAWFTVMRHPAVAVILWVTFGLFSVCFLFQTWQLQLPQLAYAALYDVECYVVLTIVTAIAALLIWRVGPSPLRVTLRQIFAFTALVAFALGGVDTIKYRQPLRICFRASQSHLDSLADQIADRPPETPQDIERQVGYYTIATAYSARGAVILRLDHFISSHFYYGFIRVPGNGDKDLSGIDYGLPDSRFEHLIDDWHVFYSYYVSVKTGWS